MTQLHLTYITCAKHIERLLLYYFKNMDPYGYFLVKRIPLRHLTQILMSYPDLSDFNDKLVNF